MKSLGKITLLRLCLLASVLLFDAGCSSDGPKQQWDNFKKEIHDDIILKSDFSHSAPADSPAPTTNRN
jgi:hypothetical protein